MMKQIYFNILGSNYDADNMIDNLNLSCNNHIFYKTTQIDTADIYILILGENDSLPFPTAATPSDIAKNVISIILVEAKLFEQYESCIEESTFLATPSFVLIHSHNTSENRKWIYTYNAEEDIFDIVKHILLSPIYEISIEKTSIDTMPNSIFRNKITLKNNGYIQLEGYYLEGYNSYSSQCKLIESSQMFFPVTQPDTSNSIELIYLAPATPGKYTINLLLRNTYFLTRTKSSQVSFIVNVLPLSSEKYDLQLLHSNRSNGEILFGHENFQQHWTLKNNTNKNWEYIELVKENENVVHLFSLDETHKKIYNVKANDIIEIEVNYYPPDLPGNYVSRWKLFDPNGIEITTDVPLLCIAETKRGSSLPYTINDNFVFEEGILDLIESYLKKLFSK